MKKGLLKSIALVLVGAAVLGSSIVYSNKIKDDIADRDAYLEQINRVEELERGENDIPYVDIVISENLPFDMTDMDREDNEDIEKLMKDLEGQEDYIVDPFPVWTASNSIIKAYEATDMGKLTTSFSNTSVNLQYSYSFDTARNDAKVAIVFPGKYNDKRTPIGVPKGCSVIYDINSQSGKTMANAKKGDKIYITNSYGQFLYEIIRVSYGKEEKIPKTGIWSNELDTDIHINDIELSVFDYSYQGYLEGLIYYTEYPFDSTTSNERFVIFAKLIKGTKLQ